VESKKAKGKRQKCTLMVSFFTFTLYFLLLPFYFLLFLSGCQNQALYKDNRIAMGTFLEVISPDKRAPGIVFVEIQRIENLLSKYNRDSEVYRLNKLGKLKVSPDTFYVIKKSVEFWRSSDGAFDITVAPLVDLWGFTEKKYNLPKDAEIKSALALVGSDKIILHEENNVVEFKTPGMRIDLGAIAKGYALDLAVEKLKAANINSCLINLGGQIYCLGDRFGLPWRVAIRSPRQKEFAGYLKLKDRAVATSGDYEQYFSKGNKRYCHILNPKTGYPASGGIVSVTIIASDGLTADALATAIFVLGKVKGEAILRQFPGTEARIISRQH